MAVSGKGKCGYESDSSFTVEGINIDKREEPYQLRSKAMEDDMDTLIDGQSSGKHQKDKRRGKSADRGRQTSDGLEFHTPGPSSGTKQMMAATEPDGMQAMQQMLTAMLQLQMDNDRR